MRLGACRNTPASAWENRGRGRQKACEDADERGGGVKESKGQSASSSVETERTPTPSPASASRRSPCGEKSFRMCDRKTKWFPTTTTTITTTISSIDSPPRSLSGTLSSLWSFFLRDLLHKKPPRGVQGSRRSVKPPSPPPESVVPRYKRTRRSTKYSWASESNEFPVPHQPLAADGAFNYSPSKGIYAFFWVGDGGGGAVMNSVSTPKCLIVFIIALSRQE